jgi:hypothetical protein
MEKGVTSLGCNVSTGMSEGQRTEDRKKKPSLIHRLLIRERVFALQGANKIGLPITGLTTCALGRGKTVFLT